MKVTKVIDHNHRTKINSLDAEYGKFYYRKLTSNSFALVLVLYDPYSDNKKILFEVERNKIKQINDEPLYKLFPFENVHLNDTFRGYQYTK